MQWITERCSLGTAGETAPRALYADYAEWKQARGEKPASINPFSERMERIGADMGFRKVRLTKSRLFVGIALKSSGAQHISSPYAD